MGVHDFQEICASCHEADIVGKSGRRRVGTALPLISVPGLDAVTRMILASEPDTTAALDVLGDRSLEDLADASAAEFVAVDRVAWASKDLMMGMRLTGREDVHARLSSAVPADALAKFDALSGAFRASLLYPAIDEWFPGLSGEIALHEAGKTTMTVMTDGTSDDPENLGPCCPGGPSGRTTQTISGP
jgi:hypothetical protein